MLSSATTADPQACNSSTTTDTKVRCPGQVLVNASLSDVVATTSAEALAMGKWILVARHPENAFFEQFKNCLIYDSSDDFVRCVVRNLPQWQCITESLNLWSSVVMTQSFWSAGSGSMR